MSNPENKPEKSGLEKAAEAWGYDPKDPTNPQNFPPELKDMVKGGIAGGFLLSDHEFHRLLNYFGLMTRSLFQGKHSLPPVVFVTLHRPDEEIQEIKAAFAEQNNMSVTELEEFIAESDGAFHPAMMRVPTQKDFEDRWKWMREQGEKFDDNPTCVIFVAETWMASPPQDENDWDEEDRKLARGELMPSQYSKKSEAVAVSAQTLDGRAAVRMFPIDRDPDDNMLIGPEDMRFRREGSNVSANIVREFWIGYAGAVLKKFGIDENHFDPKTFKLPDELIDKEGKKSEE